MRKLQNINFTFSKSFKVRIVALVLISILVSTVGSVTLVMNKSFKLANDMVSQSRYESLSSAENTLNDLFLKSYKDLSLNDSRYPVDMLNEFTHDDINKISLIAKSTDSSIALLIKKGNSFEGVAGLFNKAKNIDEIVIEGRSEMYKSLVKNNSYVGETKILGDNYLVKLKPLLDSDENIFGAYIIAKNVDNANVLLSENMKDIINSVLIIGILYIIITFMIGYKLANQIAKPILGLDKRIKEISNYDLRDDDNDFGINRRDEIGLLVKNTNTMKENLISLVKDLSLKVNVLTDSSKRLYASNVQSNEALEEITKVVEEISKGAEEEAINTTECMVAMHDLKDMTNESINNTTQLVQHIESMAGDKNLALVEVEELNANSKIVEDTILLIEKNVLETNKSAISISHASKLIKEISERTDLLALNAAIEAAKAGESGKGFSVISNEMRKLAEESKSSAIDIDKMLNSLLNDSSVSTEAVSEAKIVIEKQYIKVENVLNIFNEMAEKIDEANTLLKGILSFANQSLDKTESVFALISNLSAISEENAASTQEALASIEEQSMSTGEILLATEKLNELALDLQGVIDKFKLE